MHNNIHALAPSYPFALLAPPDPPTPRAEGVDDDDQVLGVMAERLGGAFVPLVGGPAHAHALLGALEVLATLEEGAVRERAVASLCEVVALLPGPHVASHAWALLRRLGDRDAVWFTARTSACGLVAAVYQRLPGSARGGAGGDENEEEAKAADGAPAASREDCLALYAQLCGADQVPMVRRAAAAALADVATALAGGALRAHTTGNAAATAAAAAGAGAVAEGKEDGNAMATGPASGAHVELGDASAASAPPAVPSPVVVSGASQESAAAAVARLLPLLAGLAQDEQDGVRLLAVDGCVALARLVNGGMASGAALAEGAASASTTAGTAATAATAALGAAEDVAARLRRFGEEREQVLGVLAALAKDHAWRVRWSVANRLGELADALGPALSAERLLPRFQGLLLDGEAEVRTAAAYRVRDLGAMVGRAALLESVLPCVGRLAEDASDAVRAALSSVVLGLAPVLGQAATVESLLPLFLRLLKDGSAQVRLNVIAHLEALNGVLGVATLAQSLLPAVQELSADRSWRVRQATVDFMPQLARQLGPAAFEAQPELAELCLAWLADPVFAVREAAAANLRRLAEVFGAAWAEAVLVPRLLALRPEDARTAFQQRMTALAAMVALGEAAGAPLLAARLLPAIARLARDAVPNVRFSVARSLQRLAASSALRGAAEAPAAVRDVVRPCLEGLAADADADVRFFAQRALSSL